MANMKNKILITILTSIVFISMLQAQVIGKPFGVLKEVNAPAVKKMVVQKLTEVKPGLPFLNQRRNIYLVPFVDKSDQIIFSLRIDARSGDILPVGKMPSVLNPISNPKLNVQQINDKIQKIQKDKCLLVGKVFQNPRGFYFVEIKCKKGKTLAFVKSDGKTIW